MKTLKPPSFGFCVKPIIALFCGLAAVGGAAVAQPPAGPYGPTQQRYEIPEDAGRVIYVAPDAAPSGDGSRVGAPTTLGKAISLAETGDAIILRGGVYRVGDLALNQGITLQPYESERPILKGTHVAEDWEELRDGVWRIKWDRLFPARPEDWWRRERELMRTPLHLFNNDMVFADGRFLKSVAAASLLDADSHYIDYEMGYVYIRQDPRGKLMEITAFDNAITRVIGEAHGKRSDKLGPKIRGIVFTQYAYRAIEIEGKDPEGVSPESEHGKDVVGTTIEHCEISFCSRVGGYFRGDNLVIRHCLISDTSTEGLFILSSNDVLLERNIIRRNNIEGITGYYPSGVKIFNQCYRVTCRENLVIDQPNSSGIWYDVGNIDGVFVNNWIEGSNNGFFFEISKGAICSGNVFIDCNKGVWVLNSSDVKVYRNTFKNSLASFERTERSAQGDHFGWHPQTGPDVDEREGHAFVGNLLVADADFRGPLVSFPQREILRDRLKEPAVSEFDHNVYVRRGDVSRDPVIAWSPSMREGNLMELESPAALNALLPQFEGNSQLLADYHGPVFTGEHLKRLELSPAFPHARLPVPPLASGQAGRGSENQSDAAAPGAFSGAAD